MATAAQILALLLSLQPYPGDKGESTEAREARLAPWAQALERYPADVQAAVITLGIHESHYAAYVTEGRCSERPKACDHGHAKGPYQLHSWCKADDPAGQTACAASLIQSSFRRCDTWAGAFGAYATGGRCVALDARATTRQRIIALLR
jgi:hypothetical protein